MAVRLGIDVGGSGIKAAMVDTATGELVSERLRLPTPKPAAPEAMAATIRELTQSLEIQGPVGCCFPSVIVDGEARTAGNIDQSWIGTHVGQTFGPAVGAPVVALNDADAAAMAEMELGAGRGLAGMVLTLTIGTGIGSGLFYNGVLVPNLEIGWMPSDFGMAMERYTSDRTRKAEDLGWKTWAERLDYFLHKTVRVFTPDHIILGGGASKKMAKFAPYLTIDVPLHAAVLQNNAGIVGAAMFAERAGEVSVYRGAKTIG